MEVRQLRREVFRVTAGLTQSSRAPAKCMCVQCRGRQVKSSTHFLKKTVAQAIRSLSKYHSPSKQKANSDPGLPDWMTSVRLVCPAAVQMKWRFKWNGCFAELTSRKRLCALRLVCWGAVSKYYNTFLRALRLRLKVCMSARPIPLEPFLLLTARWLLIPCVLLAYFSMWVHPWCLCVSRICLRRAVIKLDLNLSTDFILS